MAHLRALGAVGAELGRLIWVIASTLVHVSVHLLGFTFMGWVAVGLLFRVLN